MFKFHDVTSSKNDEYYTPKYAVDPILEFVKPNSIIWCPFDTEDSFFFKRLKEEGHNVINTHIDNGEDFFELDIECDYIISNPPYSLKGDVLQRLFDLQKPFAMLLGVVGIFESQKRFDMFKENDFEVLYLNRRVDFFQDFNEIKPSKNPPFSSAYFCHKMLDKQIMFREIDKKNIK